MTKNLSLFLLLIFSSCEKPKTWECTCGYNGLNGTGKTTTTIANTKQKEADKECKSYGQEQTGGLGSYTCNIEVK